MRLTTRRGREPADWLREKFTREGERTETEVEQVFRGDRHRTVHHEGVNSDELRETLAAAALVSVRVVDYRGPDGQMRATIEFPEATVARRMFGDPASPACLSKELTNRSSGLPPPPSLGPFISITTLSTETAHCIGTSPTRATPC